MANFPLKTATIQKQKETKLRSRARRSQNISKFEGAGIDFKKKKKRKENKISIYYLFTNALIDLLIVVDGALRTMIDRMNT